MAGKQKQHVDLFRKSLLRRTLLRAAADGPAYVPFCGDGDLAVAHYADRRVFGADLDPDRVAVAQSRLQGATLLVTNCDAWPFPEATEPFAVADFDAYADPYTAMRAFWEAAPKASRLVCFGTDGLRQAVKRRRTLRLPDGRRAEFESLEEARSVYNAYWQRIIRPWLEGLCAPWRIALARHYLRQDMLYWGAVLER